MRAAGVLALLALPALSGCTLVDFLDEHDAYGGDNGERVTELFVNRTPAQLDDDPGTELELCIRGMAPQMPNLMQKMPLFAGRAEVRLERQAEGGAVEKVGNWTVEMPLAGWNKAARAFPFYVEDDLFEAGVAYRVRGAHRQDRRGGGLCPQRLEHLRP